MMTLDECIAAARLPIDVWYNANARTFYVHNIQCGQIFAKEYYVSVRDGMMREDRARLSQQQGENR